MRSSERKRLVKASVRNASATLELLTKVKRIFCVKGK